MYTTSEKYIFVGAQEQLWSINLWQPDFFLAKNKFLFATQSLKYAWKRISTLLELCEVPSRVFSPFFSIFLFRKQLL